ncbi:MAG: BMP family lipoprotein [Anaerolineales bacterium]
MKKVSFIVVLVMILAMLLSACSTQTASQKIKIALVLPSTVDDLSWSQGMTEGVKAAQKELGEDKVEVAISERLGNPTDAAAAIRQYASQGYDLIIAHGSQYQSILDEIAKEFPKTSFAYGTGFQAHDNIFAYDPQSQEGAYLQGIIAGKLTKSNIIGIVGPIEAGDAIKYNVGFQQGVKSVNPNADVRVAYTGSFGDIAKASELAKAQIDAGADILTGTAQQTVGAIKACAEKPGIYWLGNDMDQSSIAPDTVLSAQAYDWKNVVMQMIKFRQEGKVGGEHLVLSLANGGIQLVFNQKLANVIPADVMALVEQAKKDIIAGKLTIELPK